MSGERTQTDPEPDTDFPFQSVPSGKQQPCHQEATVKDTIPECLLKLFLTVAYFKSLSNKPSEALASACSGAGIQTWIMTVRHLLFRWTSIYLSQGTKEQLREMGYVNIYRHIEHMISSLMLITALKKAVRVGKGKTLVQV